jgi:ribonuclease HI
MITIFTDGAARGNPGPGGWGAIMMEGGFVTELGGREDHTTNNRMEMTAVVSALESLPDAHEMQIVTDSAYVLNGATRWIFGWRKNGWKRIDSKTKKEQELLNADLWQKIYDLTSHRVIDWRLVKGHAGHPANERCDEIATNFADKKSISLFSGKISDYYVAYSELCYFDIPFL